MKTPKIVILRGRPTSGKTTAFHMLKNRKEMKGWIMIDFCAIKGVMIKTLDQPGKKLANKVLYAILKEAMKTKKNILVEETSEKSLRKNINYSIGRYDYKIITFQFTVDTKTAHNIDIKRAKELWHLKLGKKLIDKLHKMHDENIDPKGIIVDTNKLNEKQVVNKILKELKLK